MVPSPCCLGRQVDSDGHCLYRAIHHQLEARSFALEDLETGGHRHLRGLAARYMRVHPGDFAPFLDLSGHVRDGDQGMEPAFERYCDRVEGSADWGGHTELLALSNVLHLPIRVHSAEAPPVLVGEDFGEPDTALQLTYHRHFYALGEHYNSTRPL